MTAQRAETPGAGALAGALQRWHAEARKGDAGTDPALNDLAPYARIRLAADAAGQPGPVLAEVTLTARHADYLASCLAGSFGGFATASPPALAEWLASTSYAPPGTAACWFVACDAAGTAEAQVPLNADGAAGLAGQLGAHQTWLAGEQFLASQSPFREGGRVTVTGAGPARGRCGTVARVQLADIDPGPDWLYNVRLDGDVSGFAQTFHAAELAAAGEG